MLQESPIQAYPGRSLALSPAWDGDGAAVVFDRNSGDYWIVSPLAYQVVRRIVATGREGATELVQHLTDGKTSATDAETVVIGVIRELVQREILTDA
ncbi:MAG TPA: hypothetical protein VJ673_15470 [Aromatoleum sp.]|uniref:hypothetical protein n=1 Tax=Aromatoleum sp. TaxID=2307007 RepID=UPI002B49002F|nr:hypothetical protein [Aromatoleum sp.]HJV27084.1 hypothetical protein [Aromatoleum sp.]